MCPKSSVAILRHKNVDAVKVTQLSTYNVLKKRAIACLVKGKGRKGIGGEGRDGEWRGRKGKESVHKQNLKSLVLKLKDQSQINNCKSHNPTHCSIWGKSHCNLAICTNYKAILVQWEKFPAVLTTSLYVAWKWSDSFHSYKVKSTSTTFSAIS